MNIPRSPKERICVALDVRSLDEAKRIIDELEDDKPAYYKVGKELHSAEGPPAIKLVTEAGSRCFLDLKLHDIPETVGKTVAVHARQSVSITNLHIAGGAQMMGEAMRRAQQAASSDPSSRMKVIGVTMLTSLTRLMAQEVGFLLPNANIHDECYDETAIRLQVVKLAKLAKSFLYTPVGEKEPVHLSLDGVVCSALEASAIREACGPDFLIVTPGIRSVGSSADDQQRVETPDGAVRAGSDLLVIGRDITQPKQGTRRDAYRRALDAVAKAM